MRPNIDPSLYKAKRQVNNTNIIFRSSGTSNAQSQQWTSSTFGRTCSPTNNGNLSPSIFLKRDHHYD